MIDPNNAYARLGVSPLLRTEDIRAFISQRRGKVVGARRGVAAQGFGAAEAEMTRLQEIEAEIGTPRARAAYDQAHPQNELLTVQPGPDDRRFEPRERADLVSPWLAEELADATRPPGSPSIPLGPGSRHSYTPGEPDALFPSPECRALWSLSGIDEGLAEILARFPRDDAPMREAPAGSRWGLRPQTPGGVAAVAEGAESGDAPALEVAELASPEQRGPGAEPPA